MPWHEGREIHPQKTVYAFLPPFYWFFFSQMVILLKLCWGFSTICYDLFLEKRFWLFSQKWKTYYIRVSVLHFWIFLLVHTKRRLTQLKNAHATDAVFSLKSGIFGHLSCLKKLSVQCNDIVTKRPPEKIREGQKEKTNN